MGKLPARSSYEAFGMVNALRREDRKSQQISKPKEAEQMPSNAVTFVGNITKDPELRFTPTGVATLTFNLAVNERWQNKQTNEWEESVSFIDVVCWREMAENISESVLKGTRVIVTGKVSQRSWETEAGERRSKLQVNADEIGPSLRWATAQIVRSVRQGPGTEATTAAREPSASRAQAPADVAAGDPSDSEPF